MTPPMHKIFVSAYACEPGLGSEIGVGWHWVLEMSRYFELWVLTRESNRPTIEPWIEEHPEYSGIHFLYFDLPRWARFWKKGMRGVRIYYSIWQRCTNRIVKRTMRENDIKIYHLLTYGNMLWKVSSYGQKQFFIWGPASFGTSTPADFTKHYGFSNRLKEALQRLIKKTAFINLGFRNRCRNANLILCKTDETIECIPKKYKSKCVQFTDVAVGLRDIPPNTYRPDNENITFFTAGTMVGWRNFDVLIDAFAEAAKIKKNIYLLILGGGKEYNRIYERIKERNMSDYIKMPGQVEIETYYKLLAESDVVVNPCFREGAVTLSFDSLSFSKPLICFDTKGYTHSFTNKHCCIIKDIKTREEAVKQLTDKLLFLTNRDRINEMGKNAYKVGLQLDWKHKGERIYEIICKSFDEYTSGTIK